MPKPTPKSDNLKSAQATNPKWLETARLFYAESFSALRKREIRAPKEDWADLSEEEQTFALAHLQYLDLMAQAGTQRLLVQIRDLLDEIAERLATEREVTYDATGEDDEDGNADDDSDFDDSDGAPASYVPQPVQPVPPVQPAMPFNHPIPRGEPVMVVPDDSDGDDPGRVA